MPNVKRRQFFVDPKVQGALVLRAVGYWLFCLVTIALMILFWKVATGPARPFWTHINAMWFQFGPAFVASICLLPLVVIDTIRLSNRFAGPFVRLRRSMRELAEGESVADVHFRDDDFWRDFAEDFNRLRRRMSALERAEQLRLQEAIAPHSDDDLFAGSQNADLPRPTSMPIAFDDSGFIPPNQIAGM